MTEYKRSLRDIRKKIEKNKPLVHCLAPFVSANDMANALLSVGASPIMANAEEEMDEVVSHADALCVSTGILNKDKKKAIERALERANKKNIPVVLDPVGIGVSSYRRQFVLDILDWAPVTILRGNAAELRILFDGCVCAKGVDSLEENFELKRCRDVVHTLATKYKICVAMTGPVDVIGDQKRRIENRTGHSFLTKLTGAGCVLSALIAAFAAVGNDPWEMTASAIRFYGRAAEKAAREVGDRKGVYDFRNALMRQLKRRNRY